MQHLNVLVVEDEPLQRLVTITALRKVIPGQIHEAISGSQALALLESCEAIDIAICDLKMPGLSGAETVRLIRKKDKKTPIFIVTAFSKAYAADLKQLQNDKIEFQVMSKPLPSEQIVAVVEGVLGGRVS